MEVSGDPRAALEKDWGPLPVPAGATYDAACSAKHKTAIFFLGLKVDAAERSSAASQYKTAQAALDADAAAGRPVSWERRDSVMQLMFGTPASRALVAKVVKFLEGKGMVVVSPLGMPLLQMPGNSPTVERVGYTLAASVDGTGQKGHSVCESAGGPTLQFGKR